MTVLQDRPVTTTTSATVHPVVSTRWSTRAFDPAPLADAEVVSLLEAARWAPSAMNHQPWRFLVGRRNAGGADATYTGILTTMAPPNRAWAQNAPLLVAALVRVTEEDGAPRSVGPYELGLAVAQLTAQATSLGLAVHQIGGFDHDALAAAFDVPAAYAPLTVLAIGRPGDPALLPDWARAREGAPRTRLALEEIAYAGTFGTPSRLVTADPRASAA